MRTGLIVSGMAHALVIAWGFVSLTSSPLDASSIEMIPVDFVTIGDTTKLTKGIQTANLVAPAPVMPPAEKPKPVPPPLPKPAPPPTPTPDPAPTPPSPAPPPEPMPPPADATPPPLPTPDAVTPPPPDATAAVPLKDVPIPRVRPKPKATLPPEKAPDADMEAIQALLDKRRLEEMASTEAPPTQSPPTVGVPDAAPSASMTANELELLRSRLAQCWAPPLGWTDPTEVRVVLVLSLNPDGSVAGRPQVLESPQGQYSNAAPESAIRAVMRCAPYSLPAAKYDSWKQVKITFDPRDMGAT